MSKTINALTPEQHTEYLELLDRSKSDNLRIVHVREKEFFEYENDEDDETDEDTTYFQYSQKGGATGVVGINKNGVSDSRNYKVASLATSLCHPNEIFVKKVGTYFALKAYYNGNRIQIRVRDDLTPQQAAIEILTKFYEE